MPSDVTVREIRFVTAFPWLRLGRAFGCALAPQSAALACLAVILWMALVPFVRPKLEPVMIGIDLDWSTPGVTWFEPFVGPATDIVYPARACLAGEPGWWRHGVAAAAAFVLWSVVGLAVCRCAAVQFCRDQNPSLAEAARFAMARIGNVCGAPLIPLLGAVVLCAIVAVLSLPAWIVWFGDVWLAVLSPVLFVLSAAAAFIVLIVPLLWPLMVASIAADDGDAFDAFSRAFSLVASRFWSTLGLAIVCAIEAFVAAVLLGAIANAGVWIAVWSADWLISKAAAATVAKYAGWWAVVTVRGLMASLFWTLATIVYLFLREMVDAVPTSQLKGYEDTLPSRDPYPVVGIAATEPTAPRE